MLGIKEKIRSTGRTLEGWAKVNGFSPHTVRAIDAETMPTTGTVGKAIKKALKKDKLWPE